MTAAILYPRSERVAEVTRLRRNGSENKLKRGRQKTVSWPIDEKMCEVCHFLVDDAPSVLGVAVQEHFPCKQRSLPFAHNIHPYKRSDNHTGFYPLEVKRARLTSVMKPGEELADVPPGFSSSICKTEPLELEAVMAMTVPWHCPHEFNLDGAWLWAGGEESTEVALQQQRERRVFEIFYPRLSSIPDSPAEPQEICKDDDATLESQIPLIPLEEEVDRKDTEPEEMIIESDCTVMPLPEHGEIADVPVSSDNILHRISMGEPVKCQQVGLMCKADSSVAAVAAAACMVVKALGERDLVDETLLLEILKNPSLLKSLTFSNQVVKEKMQDQNHDTGMGVAQEHVTSTSGKFPTDHGAYLNASPVSVLAKWSEGVRNNGSSYGETLIASKSLNTRQSANLNSTSMRDNTIYSRRNSLHEKGEIAPRWHNQIPDLSENLPYNPSNLQGPPLMHVYPRNDESRNFPSVSGQNGFSTDLQSTTCNVQLVQAVATANPIFSTLSVQAITTPNPTRSVLPTSLSTSELPRRTPLQKDPPLRRVVKNEDISLLQAKKKTACSVFPNSGGRAKRFCMYFNSPRGCRNGGSCAFVHQSLDSELDAMAQ